MEYLKKTGEGNEGEAGGTLRQLCPELEREENAFYNTSESNPFAPDPVVGGYATLFAEPPDDCVPDPGLGREVTPPGGTLLFPQNTDKPVLPSQDAPAQKRAAPQDLIPQEPYDPGMPSPEMQEAIARMQKKRRRKLARGVAVEPKSGAEIPAAPVRESAPQEQSPTPSSIRNFVLLSVIGFSLIYLGSPGTRKSVDDLVHGVVVAVEKALRTEKDDTAPVQQPDPVPTPDPSSDLEKQLFSEGKFDSLRKMRRLDKQVNPQENK